MIILNISTWLRYLISLHSPAFDVSFSFLAILAEFGTKDRILTKVSASKALPNHVKSFLENRAITPLFLTRSTLLGNKHGCSRAVSLRARTCVLPIKTGHPMLIVTMRLKDLAVWTDRLRSQWTHRNWKRVHPLSRTARIGKQVHGIYLTNVVIFFQYACNQASLWEITLLSRISLGIEPCQNLTCVKILSCFLLGFIS